MILQLLSPNRFQSTSNLFAWPQTRSHQYEVGGSAGISRAHASCSPNTFGWVGRPWSNPYRHMR